jgi:signal transduction histidine kinase
MSLRMRLILSYVLIVVLCLSIVVVTVVMTMQSSRDRLVTASLNDVALPLYAQEVRALAQGEASLAEVWSNLAEAARENDVYIFWVDSDGGIIRQASPLVNSRPQLITVAPEELPHDISQPTQGTFVDANGRTFIFAAYPFGRLTTASAASRLGTLVIALPRSGTSAIWAAMIRPSLLAGLVALCVSVAVAFFLTRSVYRPIQRVTGAAGRIAQGQYDQEVPVAGPREVRGLAVSFNEMAKKVQQAQQQLRHFVADVSHQLRTPLTSIRGFAQAMLDGTASDDEARMKAARIIEDESKRMIRQVNELLELSRMQSGQVQMARELVDVKELLGHCQEIFAIRAEESGQSIKMEIEPLVPVAGDIDRLEQVFSNLLDNALKNSPPQSEVRITARNSGADSVEVVIADSGPGIPPEQLPYVFERFYQASGVRSGAGLGLAIAREIVVAHGGQIEASSAPGEGAQFAVRLPAGSRL